MHSYLRAQISPYITRIVCGVDDASAIKNYCVDEALLASARCEAESGDSPQIGPAQITLLPDAGAIRLHLGAGTACYGLGQHQDGLLDRAGQRLTLKHENTSIAMPLLLTEGGYAILWNHAGVVEVDLRADAAHTFRNQTERHIDFFVIQGDGLAEQMRQYWTLTGGAVMPPKAAFGYWQSKMRYQTQRELLEVARAYRERRYPLDILVIDFYHWTQMGDFRFDPACWPDPEAMCRELRDQGVKSMVSVWPYIDVGSENHGPMSRDGQLVRDRRGRALEFTIFNGAKSGLYDPFNKDARDAYWERIRRYREQGIDYWWLDSCEPDDGLNLQDFEAEDVLTADGPLRERVNAYALLHCRGVYEGQRRDAPDERVLILARAAFPGCQRYGVVVWSGDIGYDFHALRTQLIAGLGASLSGLPFWTTDIGGFRGGDPGGEEYRELYIRWFQYAAFCPLLRAHGSRGATCLDDLIFGISRGENEVWSFGEQAESILAAHLRLRRAMLPYLYSTARQTVETGLPMMRALALAFPDDQPARACLDQYMLGDALLVCPVLEPGARARDVYLPKGHVWYDYWSDQVHPGGQVIRADAPLVRLPLYVMGGSILPMRDASDALEIHIYPGSDARFPLYDDDGETYAYEKGAYDASDLRWNDRAKTLAPSGLPMRLHT